MIKAAAKQPEHATIYQQVRKLILFGALIPGQPVTIHGLAESIGSGVTPVREAIRRLIAEGALVALENRRVELPVMTVHRLDQILFTRSCVEPELAVRSCKNSGKSLVPRLLVLDDLVNRAIETGDVQRYLEANYQFHFLLYDAANAPVLRRIAASLWLQVGPSLRVVCGRFGTANLKDHHREATDALSDGDPGAVRRAIEDDIRQGSDFIRQSLGVS